MGGYLQTFNTHESENEILKVSWPELPGPIMQLLPVFCS